MDNSPTPTDAERAIAQSEEMLLKSYRLIQVVLDQVTEHRLQLDASWEDLMAKKEQARPPQCDRIALARKKRQRLADPQESVPAIVVK